MRDGSGQVEGAQTRERHFVPLVIEALPVEWRFPSLTLHGVPAIGQPVAKVAVATIFDKRQVLAIGYETVSQGKILDQHLVHWLFIVETKTRSVMANLVRATREGDEVRCGP
jgi:hypothetical protein